MFWNFLSTYLMDTKPRNTRIIKMKQNDVKIKLDKYKYIPKYIFYICVCECLCIYIDIHNKIRTLYFFRTACKMQQKNVKQF